MKKVTFFIFILALSVSFLSLKKYRSLGLITLQSNQRTLNGVDYKQAFDMIKTFTGKKAYKKDIGVKSVTAWFSNTDIQTMRSALEGEKGKVDGVRFYLGAVSKNNTKLKIKIFLVMTAEKKPKPIATKMNTIHDDYPSESSLLTGELGLYYDHMADQLSQKGGLLYGDSKPIMSENCTNQSVHRMNNDDTYYFVQERDDKPDTRPQPVRICDRSGYNTKSEWYDICFISSLFDAILNSQNKLDGLRVYLAEGHQANYTANRDVFILVPTHAADSNHEDDFKCLYISPSSLCTLQNPRPFRNPDKAATELLREFRFRYFSRNRTFMDGGYDNGELCPTHCP